MVLGDAFERRDSCKRRRLSERRRAFSRLSGRLSSNQTNSRADEQRNRLAAGGQAAGWSASSANAAEPSEDELLAATGSIAMKIQFHIRVAPENEPLILDTNWPPQAQPSPQTATTTFNLTPSDNLRQVVSGPNYSNERQSTGSVEDSEQMQTEKSLTRQSTASSTKKRQHLLAMHKQTASKGDDSSRSFNGQEHKLPSGSGSGSEGAVGKPSLSSEKALDCEPQAGLVRSEDNIALQREDSKSRLRIQADCEKLPRVKAESETTDQDVGEMPKLPSGKDGRSSTITDGMPTDQATMMFLAQHQRSRPREIEQLLNQPRRNTLQQVLGSSASSQPQAVLSGSSHHGSSAALFEQRQEREQIYFKRDGQRFGHEFTLKLAVHQTYRCLLKVRPLIPLQSILIQGQPVQFVDCTGTPGNQQSASGLTAGSRSNAAISIEPSYRSAPALSSSWQNLHLLGSTANYQLGCATTNTSNLISQRHRPSQVAQFQILASQNNHHQHNHQTRLLRARLNHAQTVCNVSRPESSTGSACRLDTQLLSNFSTQLGTGIGSQLEAALIRHQLRLEQQSQMLRSFAGSHSSSSSNTSHLGSQLIYMFDWSAGHFEANKNKARTIVQTVLKFKNGQIITLPLQVKFYPAESRQHLNWGSQLHFIDYDCTINEMGAIGVDRVQYY